MRWNGKEEKESNDKKGCAAKEWAVGSQPEHLQVRVKTVKIFDILGKQFLLSMRCSNASD
jgi:hypothetical protein